MFDLGIARMLMSMGVFNDSLLFVCMSMIDDYVLLLYKGDGF